MQGKNMNPRHQFCSNDTCPDKGKTNQGNIVIHSRKDRRYKCKTCGTTFTETKGTVLYGLKKDSEQVFQVVTLLACGCPVQAIVEAFHMDERYVPGMKKRVTSVSRCMSI
jgi:transposase-like protein